MAIFYRDTFVKLENSPGFPSEIDVFEEFGSPTQEQVVLNRRPSLDNFTPVAHDPLNWYIFDPGSETNPKFVTDELFDPGIFGFGNGIQWGEQGSLQPLPCGGMFDQKYSHGTNFNLYSNGGPRNKGYTRIDDGTWIHINNGIGSFDSVLNQWVDPHTEVWREGSIEFTIKPEKNNCTIFSGTLYPRTYGVSSSDEALGGSSDTVGKSPTVSYSALAHKGQLDPDAPDNSEGQLPHLRIERKVGPNSLTQDITAAAYTNSGGQYAPDYDKGLVLSNIESGYRTFSVKLIDGKIKIIYEILYGIEKRKIEIDTNTNIVDGEWHHIIINRPSELTKKTSEQNHTGEGSIEVWIDGELDTKSYEIKSNMLVPVPMILFNDSLNPGILNFERDTTNGFNFIENNRNWKQYLPADQYVGGIRDFVFRHTLALSEHFIKLNYIYAMLNGDGARIIKPRKSTATANIVQPEVSVNKTKVLKLYWNSLLKEKQKCLDGLELDETYQVYSTSTTHKNIFSLTQTMNLDLNINKQNPTFLTNVKTAIGKPVFTLAPGIQYSQDSYLIPTGEQNWWAQYDITLESAIARSHVENYRFVNNLLYGGSFLQDGDKVLLFNQPTAIRNGVWIFNGPNQPMTRPADLSGDEISNVFVYVEDGKYKNTTFYQKNIISNPRDDAQDWVQVDNEISIAKLESYPIHGNRWINSSGDQDFININSDIDFDYDVIVFANYPQSIKDIINSLDSLNETEILEKYRNFINNLKIAVDNGKSIFISSPQLAVDFGAVNKVANIPQLLNETGDAQSASISPFENGEPSEYYFNTHRNNKYHLATELAGLTDKTTYLMTDFVTYSPDRTKSDYHIKYNYRQFGIQEGDEFYIPGLTTIPETLNEQLPGYLYNQKSTKDIPAFAIADINFGTPITKFTNTLYSGSNIINNPYDDYITTIAGYYGDGKVFINCVEDGYAFSREDYNKATIQNVVVGENSETVNTAAWQYSTKRLNKKDLYDFSENANPIGQTDPTSGGGGAIVQSQSHCSNAFIRKQFNKNDLQYQSDLYPDYSEEVFTTTEIPVLSMTWLGLQWLAE